jgi:allophanate hydrolase
MSAPGQPVWISRVGERELTERASALRADARELPLRGARFAVKDNIDVAGMPTTAACPGAARVAEHTAPVVERLVGAGALLVGKTNMDQFATGLVGTRSPHGACSSVYHPDRVSGGSSSGSALAVACGEVAFALGTDTAGSGRVPAAFNGLVGVKPTRGLLSTRGVLPACASLDCVSIFSRTVAEAARALDVAAAVDAEDPWSRPEPPFASPRSGRVGVPVAGQAEPEEAAAGAAWELAKVHAGEHWQIVEVDIRPLLDAAPLLYEHWVAERTVDLGELIAAQPEGLDPTVAAIVAAGAAKRATGVFAAMHELARLCAAAAPLWGRLDALLMPTTPLHPTHEQVAADPVGVNERLGRFTNFVNLMDLCALAVPGPMREDELPFGLTLVAPPFHDRRLLELGAQWCSEQPEIALPGTVELAVAGAHMRGLELNHQLTSRGARRVGIARTAPAYRLYELPGGGVRRPGLVRTREDGVSVEIELWLIAPSALGELLADIPAPLTLGRLQLDDGREVTAFLCENHATAGAPDISEHGGWRAYLSAVRA